MHAALHCETHKCLRIKRPLLTSSSSPLPPWCRPGRPIIDKVAIAVDNRSKNTLNVDVRPPTAPGDSGAVCALDCKTGCPA